MPASPVRQWLSELFSPIPSAKPDGFADVAARLLHARHLAAYEWALPFVVDKNILEIGVNRGYGSRIIAPESAGFTGVDISHPLALQAHRETAANMVQANGLKLPFANQSFDVVVTFQVIEHVWDVRAYLLEVQRVLRPCGLLLVSTPQFKSRLYMGQMPLNSEHLREYDENSFETTLKTVFRKVESYGLFARDTADRIERRRTWHDPWLHFFGGPWAGPIRYFGRAAGRLRNAPDDVTDAQFQSFSDKENEFLLKQFYLDREKLENAHDLFAVCSGTGSSGSSDDRFDAIGYWNHRINKSPTLKGTGTIGLPLAWQQWLYHGKEMAYKRLFDRHRVDLIGKRVLDFGCGTGYFESVWERWGSGQTCGIDVVPEMIAKLERAYPNRIYLYADIGGEDADLSVFGKPELVTAIDVLYHIVDDEKLLSVMKKLVSLLPEDGHLLLTDAMQEKIQSPVHVRFRSLNQWRQILTGFGMEIIGVEPVFAFNNRPVKLSYRYPKLSGAIQHYVDIPVLRFMPWLANNWALLARKCI